MNLRSDDDTAARAMLAGWEAKASGAGGGGFAFGGAAGSPQSDWYHARRAPTPSELVDQFRGLVHALATTNAAAVAACPMRLYAVTGRGQHRPKSYAVPARRDSAARRRLKFVAECREYAGWTRKAEEIDEVTDLPFLAALDSPNPAFDRHALIEYLALSMDIVGAGYAAADSDGPDYTAIWPLLCQYVLPYRASARSLPDGFYYFGERFDIPELVWCRAPSMRDPYAFGLSPAQASFAYVGLADRYVSARGAIMDQTIDGSVLVSAADGDQVLGDAESGRWVESVRRGLAGPGRGRVKFVPMALKVDPIAVQTQGLAELQIDEHAFKVAALNFGVPNALVFAADSNRAVADSARREHAERAVLPRQGRIAGAFTRFVRSEGERLGGVRGRPLGWDRLFFAFDNPVAEDRSEQAKVFDLDLKNGSRTINEVRSDRGEGAVPWGDEPLIPSTMAPLSDAAESRKAARERPPLPDDPARDEDAEEAAQGARGKAYRASSPDDDARRMLADAAASLGLARDFRAGSLTAGQRRSLCHAVGEVAAHRLREAAEALAADLAHDDGTKMARLLAERVKSFFGSALKTIRTAALAATIGLRGPDELQADDRSHLASAVAEQEGYLDRFKAAVMDGSQKPDGTLASRAEMYGRASWAVAHKVERARAKREGMTQEKRVLGDAEQHCGVCPQLADRGFQPIGTLPEIGSTPCMTQCRCSWAFR